MYAASNAHLETVKVLLENGVKTEERDDSGILLHYICLVYVFFNFFFLVAKLLYNSLCLSVLPYVGPSAAEIFSEDFYDICPSNLYYDLSIFLLFGVLD